MGLKLNFSTFIALSNNDDRFVNQFFDSFKLTAFLLYNQNDRDFIHEINRNFDRLDEVTGKGLLFIFFTKVGDSFPFIGKFDRISLGLTEEEIKKLQEALTKNTMTDRMNLSEMARQFNVDVEQLPVIVLTDNIKSDRALIIPTNSKDVGYQLSQLAYLANDPDFHGSLDEIETDRFAPYSELIVFKRCIVNMLTNVTSRFRLQRNPSDSKAIGWNREAVNENIERLDDLVKGDNTEQEWENELVEYVYNRIVRFSAPDPNVLYPFKISEEKMVGSEDDTLMMLNTYNLFSTLLDVNGEIQRLNRVYCRYQYDYSGLSVFLGKMFEKELNWSIVQQMRQCIGIPMPEYFCKYCRDRDRDWNCVVDCNDLEDKLNNSNKRKTYWKSPSIGGAKMAYNILINTPNARDLIKLDHENEVLWDNLREGRNDAAHHSCVSREDFIDTFKLFSRFLDDNGFFSQLVRIKQQVRGELG